MTKHHKGLVFLMLMAFRDNIILLSYDTVMFKPIQLLWRCQIHEYHKFCSFAG